MTLPLEGLPEPETIHCDAVISPCGTWRYQLRRWWADGPLLDWIMLNPSTADAIADDPTIRRCIGFARDWGFNGIRVTNLFALRSTSPNALLGHDDPVGPDNRGYLIDEQGPLTVCAWGAHPAAAPTTVARLAPFVGDALEGRSALVCLGVNKDGSPKHPLYVAKNAGARPWPPAQRKEQWY